MTDNPIAPGLLQRAVDAYRVNSSAVAAALLVLFNLIPLGGVLWLGWDLVLILALYWVENGVVGVINLPKIFRAEGTGPAPNWMANGRALRSMNRWEIAGFFTMHYGLFWVVHGVFVLIFVPALVGDIGVAPDAATSTPLVFPNFGVLALGAIGLGISHGVSFWTNYIGRGEYRALSPAQLMTQPYGRLVVMHLTILVGAVVSIFLGTPVGSLLVLIVGKTALDLAFHLRQHRPTALSQAEPA